MGDRRDPGWRDQAAAELLLRHLAGVEVEGPVLVMEDPGWEVERGLAGRDQETARWDRRAWGGRSATPWPPAGPFRTATLRLPRAKQELRMAVHAAASVLVPGGVLLVYGAKDEGIESVPGSLAPLFQGVRRLGVGGHCRLFEAQRCVELPGLKATLGEWRETADLACPHLPASWVSYPGVFSHGHLDPGTRLLLDALPPLPVGARVLDYGCGSGVLGGAALARGGEISLDLLDIDAVALEAARENVPGARLLLREGLPLADQGPWDILLTNPPFHRGKAEDPGMVVELVRGAPGLLRSGGSLVLVTQKRLALEDELRRAFHGVETLVERGVFRVWRGMGPRKSWFAR